VDDVVEAPDLADAPHDLDAERDPASFPLEPRPQVAELLDDLGKRAFARALEEEAGMEDDRLGTGCDRDPGRVVEHPGRHRVLSVALDVAHETGDRRVHRQSNAATPRELSKLLGPGVVHPEAALEVDLAGGVTALAEKLDRFLGALPGRNASRPIAEFAHVRKLTARASSDGGPTLRNMAKRPTRIDLLELDIDLRLTDLWREAADVQEWNLDVVAAFMRAAYGKGYCDALTEEAPGSLCEDHGYRIPPRRRTAVVRRAA